MFSLPELPRAAVCELFGTDLLPLCRLHRKEPGWLVGEHIQVLFRGGAAAALLEKEIERFGEPGRSREKEREGEE